MKTKGYNNKIYDRNPPSLCFLSCSYNCSWEQTLTHTKKNKGIGVATVLCVSHSCQLAFLLMRLLLIHCRTESDETRTILISLRSRSELLTLACKNLREHPRVEHPTFAMLPPQVHYRIRWSCPLGSCQQQVRCKPPIHRFTFEVQYKAAKGVKHIQEKAKQ